MDPRRRSALTLVIGLVLTLSHVVTAQELPRHEIPRAEAHASVATAAPAEAGEQRQAQDRLADWQRRQGDRHAQTTEQHAAGVEPEAGDVTAQAVPNVLTLVSLRFFPDHEGDTVIVGEVRNTTATTLSFSRAMFTLFNGAGTALGTEFSYVFGSQNARLAATGGFTSVLPPDAIGFFKVWTTVPFAEASSYAFSSDAETFLTFSPRTSLFPAGSIGLAANSAGGTDYAFSVRNTGVETTSYFVMAMLAGYNNGAISDVHYSFVNGSSVTQCGVTTATAIASGASAPVASSFVQPVTSIGRLAFEWDEVGVSPAVFNGGAAGGTATANIVSQCPWTATSNSSWISVTSGASGSGDGSISFAVGANTTGVARSGSLTVAGLTVTVNQAAGAGGVPIPFTDPVLTGGMSLVKAVHINELRSRINALRNRSALPAFAWTDANLTAGATVIKGVHIAELRGALSAVYQATARSAPTFTDSTLVAGVTTIKAAHLQELRNAVVAIE